MKLEAKIALEICLAQISSDAGKGIYELCCRYCEDAQDQGYAAKTSHILNAIKLIDKSRTHFRYSVVKTEDQNGYDSCLIYFEFKENGRYPQQVSFHSPWDSTPKELKKKVGKGYSTCWNGQCGGSRAVCSYFVRRWCL